MKQQVRDRLQHQLGKPTQALLTDQPLTQWFAWFNMLSSEETAKYSPGI